MSQRTLIQKINDNVTVIDTDEPSVLTPKAVESATQVMMFCPAVEYFTINSIHLGRTAQEIADLTQDTLRRVFDYNLKKGRMLQFNGLEFAFMV